MLKGITAVCAVLCLCSCSSITNFNNSRVGKTESSSNKTAVEQKPDLNHWVTPPKSDQLVIIGVSGRQSKPEIEIQVAREDAARKVSMFYNLMVETESMQSIGTGLLDYYTASSIKVEYDQEIERYLENLVYDPQKDFFIRNNAVFIRFTYPAVFPGVIDYSFKKDSHGRPEWVTSPPHEINGFMAGVGFVRRQERISDGVMKSHEAAAASIVSHMSSSVASGETSTFIQGTSYSHHQSRGALSQFVVLETWIDPENESVWTLAVGPKAVN